MKPIKIADSINDMHSELNASKGLSIHKTAGSSMLFLISPGDNLIIKNVNPKLIKIGDIIAWKDPYCKDANIAHRIIYKTLNKNGALFLTKGDFNFLPDKKYVAQEHVLGKVVVIRKIFPTTDINIEKGLGQLMSYLFFLLTTAIKLLLLPYFAFIYSYNLFHDTRRIIHLYTDKLFNYNIVIDIDSWIKQKQMFSPLTDSPGIIQGRKIGDISFGSGYSEEAMSLIRNNIKVECIDISEIHTYSDKFEYLIASNNNPFSFFTLSHDYIRSIYNAVKPNGSLLFTIIRAYNGLDKKEVTVIDRFYRKFINLIYHIDMPINKIVNIFVMAGFKNIAYKTEDQFYYIHATK
ncbi:MAG: signal peptidase I [Elusimicrobia bacterium]|nr:signal peptidase I [Candidatus Liberimonas magnetica]